MNFISPACDIFILSLRTPVLLKFVLKLNPPPELLAVALNLYPSIVPYTESCLVPLNAPPPLPAIPPKAILPPNWDPTAALEVRYSCPLLAASP